MLEVMGLQVRYGPIHAVRGVDLSVKSGEIVALIGSNGAGKSSILKAISALVPSTGIVRLGGADMQVLAPHRRVAAGIAHAPEGRQIFAPLTVEENIRLGALRRGGAKIAKNLELAYSLFPVLAEKRTELAGTLSGGQQQMLAIVRALASDPVLLMLDEPSMGISPLLMELIFSAIARLKEQGLAILLVEQNAWGALNISDRAYVLETGTIVREGTSSMLLQDPAVRASYLGA